MDKMMRAAYLKVRSVRESARQNTDYLCWTAFSILNTFYLIFPIFFYSNYGFSKYQSSWLSTIYLIGLFVGMMSYVRLLRWTAKGWRFDTIIPERFFLGVSGVVSSLVLIILSFQSQFQHMSVLLFALGFFSSAISPLNTAILNSNKNSKRDRVHNASSQRWHQNLGSGIFFLLFAYWSGHHAEIFIVLALVGLSFSIFELLMSRGSSPSDPEVSSEKKMVNQPNRERTLFFLSAFISLAIFMQIPNVYSYYLKDAYALGYHFFSKLMILNIVLVLLLQHRLAKCFLGVFGSRGAASVGMILIGAGIVIPIFHSMLFVYVSFLLWTIGEILFFTSMRTFLIHFSSTSSSINISVKYYTAFYLSSVSSPFFLKYVEPVTSTETMLLIFFGLSLLVGLVWWVVSDTGSLP